MKPFQSEPPSNASETPRPSLTLAHYAGLFLWVLAIAFGAYYWGKITGQSDAQLDVAKKQQLQVETQKETEIKLAALQTVFDKLQDKTKQLETANLNWEFAFNDLKTSFMAQTDRMSMQAYKGNQAKHCELIQLQISDTQKSIDNSNRLLSMGIQLSSSQDQQKMTELLQLRIKAYQEQLIACKK